MSLNKVTLADVVKKQYIYKLKAYSGVYTSLVVVHVLALLFSINAFNSYGTHSDGLSINIKNYSIDMVIAFTMLWSFITAVTITTKAYRYDDFTFVTNRISSDLSNFAFLGTAAFIGTVTSLLSGFLLKVGLYLLPSTEVIYFSNIEASPVLIAKGIGATFLYILLFGAIGYLVGTLVQLHSLIKILLPVVFFGLLFFGGMIGRADILGAALGFYFTEASFTFFLLKILVTVALLLVSSIGIYGRVEVRQ